jgi:tetratricopeptide (TPR) repeat protein
MSAVQRDYIERQIELVAQAIAQIVDLIRSGQFDPALIIIRKTSELVLGPLQPVLERLDAASVVELLGKFESDRIRMYAALLSEEGTIYELRGQTARAQQCYGRALELYTALSNSGAQLKAADWDRIELLQPKVQTT